MQIQYCDGCNLRVDNREVVAVGDKIYCPTCAESHARPPSGSQAKPNSGIRRTSPSLGNARRTPAAGTLVPSRGTARAGNTQFRAASAASSSHRAPQSSAESSKTLVWGLAAIGLCLAATGLFLMTRGKSTTLKTDDSKIAVKAGPETKPSTTANTTKPAAGATTATTPPVSTTNTSTPISTPASTSTTTTTTTPPDAAPKSGLFAGGAGMEDFREDRAHRELEKIKSLNLPPFDNFKRLSKFLDSYRSTKAGKEAEQLIKAVEGATIRPPDNPGATSPGLKAVRYEIRKDKYILAHELPMSKHTPLATLTIPNIDFPNNDRLKDTFNAVDFMVLEITGYVEAPRDGTYVFSTTSDDGSLLYIGSLLLVNNDGDHAMQDQNESIPLKAGKHAIKVLYYQGQGAAGLVVHWSGPEIPREVIPASALSN